MEKAYLISVCIRGENRAVHVAVLPVVGTKAAAKQWLQANVWPGLKEEHPTLEPGDVRLDYVEMVNFEL